MKWQPSFTHKIRQVITITIVWVIAGVLMELHNAVNYDPATRRHFLYFIFGKSAFEHFLITAIGPFVGGIFAGSFIVFYQREKLKGRTYGRKLLIHSILYIVFVFSCILLVGSVGAMFNKPGHSYWQNFYNDVFSYRVLRLVIAWYFVVIFTIFLLDVSERYGPGTLRKILMGKYHTPGREQRIFMFLDLSGSTTMAEKLGDEQYFRMLHLFYQVANEAITNNYGEIYQYVGDEIVVSWPHEQGIKNANCLRCFTAVRKAVESKAAIFQKEYGLVPEFKAGIHAGMVVTGVIGSVKKDIVYSGDVMNTTARIMSLCKQYKQTLIVSDVIYAALINDSGYKFTYLDSPVLRGKTVKTGLYGVEGVG